MLSLPSAQRKYSSMSGPGSGTAFENKSGIDPDVQQPYSKPWQIKNRHNQQTLN